MGDLERELVGTTTNDEKVYRVLNNAGAPYTVVVDKDGFETYSCETRKENAMFKALDIKFRD